MAPRAKFELANLLVCYRMLIGENSRPEKTQVIRKNKFGSPGKIRTCNPSVNSRMLYR